MNPLGVVLKRIDWGWAVELTNGRELVRFTGLGARWRALRYLAGRRYMREATHAR
jgi:hypothetical protein